MLACGGLALVEHLTQTIASAHARFGLLQTVSDDANARFAATLALVLERDGEIEIVLVGDSGVRVNGGRLFQVEKDLDGITASLRASAWRRVAARTDDPQLRELVSRRVVLHGTRHAQADELISADDLRAAECEAVAACTHKYGSLPAEIVEHLVYGGILHEQKRHQKTARHRSAIPVWTGFQSRRT